MEYSYSYLILLLPFLSFLLLGLLGMKMKKPVAGLIGTAVLGVLWAMSLYTAYKYFFYTGEVTAMGQTFQVTDGRLASGVYPTITVFNFTWLKFTELLTFNIGFRLTPISVMMLIVITTVSFMVHIYSFGYMAERDENYKAEGYEKGFQRFYAFLSLFTMSMLGLVVATNIFQMYLFWEPGGCVLLPAHWLLLPEARRCACFQESIHRDPFCRSVLPHRYSLLQFLYGYVQLRPHGRSGARH